MINKKLLVIGNWKLNPLTAAEAITLANQIDKNSKHGAVIAPPDLFLGLVDFPQKAGQDCFSSIKGPYTGQTSASALLSLGAKYCIIGHSEKRNLGEDDKMVASKVSMAVKAGLIPVVCVGHGTTVDEDDLAVTELIGSQLTIVLSALAGLPELDLAKVVVAYEPVWAIGTGKSASPEHAETIALFIKTKFKISTVLYGGSVNSHNAASYGQQPDVDGFLVGGASLLPADFNAIINI